MVDFIQDFRSEFPICDPETGIISPEFLRFIQGRGSNIVNTNENVEGKVDASRQILAGTGLNGGGPLTSDVTLSADEQEILNQISTTQGVILYRGASDWEALSPGTAGQILQTGGAGANPSWVASSSSSSFKGAQVVKAADLTGGNFTTPSPLTWDSEIYDTDGFHSNTVNNTRLTIPTGVSKARLTTNITLANVTSGVWINGFIQKNGTTFQGRSRVNYDAAFGNPSFCLVTSVVDVTAGDYFEVFLQVQTDTSVDITASTSDFSIEAIA